MKLSSKAATAFIFIIRLLHLLRRQVPLGPLLFAMTGRQRKALRDKNITQNFFNQGESSTRSSSAEQSISHATSLPAFSQLNASMYPLKESLIEIEIETDHRTDAEKLRNRVSALCKRKYNNLSSEEREKVQTALEMLPTTLDPRSVLESLNLAEDQIKVVLSSDGAVIVKETFDLADLNKAIEQYDKLCQRYKLNGERQMAAIAQGISKLTSIASNTMRSTETRLSAKLDTLTLRIDSKITAPLNSCLRQIQLFNVEKRFGFVEESYQAIKQEDERKPGEDVPAKPRPSFRQALNDPWEPTEPAPETRQKKGEKKLSGLEALTQLQRNLKLASEDIQNLMDTNNTQDFEETFTYADVPIPEKIPDYVRQRFLDAECALQESEVLIEEASEQLLKVRSALLAWNGASHQTWYVHFEAIAPIELVYHVFSLSKNPISLLAATLSLILQQFYSVLTWDFSRETGKKLVHELPLFREYDHYRTALFAMLSILARSEVKIIEFFSGRRAPEFPAAMRQVFRLEFMSLEEFEKDWVGILQGNSF